MIGGNERISVYKLTIEPFGPTLPFSVEADVTDKDWEGIIKASEQLESYTGLYRFLSNVKALSYERYLQIRPNPVSDLSANYFQVRSYTYHNTVSNLEIVASLKDLSNFKLPVWQQTRLLDQFLQHRKREGISGQLAYFDLGLRALGRVVMEYQSIDKQECIEGLNNNFDPERLSSYMDYVSYVNLFGSEGLTYRPGEMTWKAMRTYLAMFRDGAGVRDWDDFVEYAALFKKFTDYAQGEEEHELPQVRKF